MNNYISQFAIGLRNISKRKEFLESQKLIELIEQSLQLGITTFDHADVYGDFSCEKIFGEALKVQPSIRKNIQIVSKCGIQIVSEKRPANQIKYFEINSEYVLSSVNQSLQNLHTDYIDLYLLHRPDFLMDTDSVANTLIELKKSGKVLNFGVSNFFVSQVEKLRSRLNFSLVVNQLNISVLNTNHFFDGTLDQCETLKIIPMAYQTLGGGKLLSDTSDNIESIRQVLTEIGNSIGNYTPEQIATAWLLKHPSGIVPIIGSLDIQRIEKIATSKEIELSQQQWYKILEASTGKEVK